MLKGEFLSQINNERAEQRRAEQLLSYEVIKSGCWIWQRGTSPDGYGKVKRFGKTIRAHRLFYEHHVGPVADGLWVLHKCDTPLCVNPEHLFAGTQLENERDKDAKGRRPEPANTTRVSLNDEAHTLKTLSAQSGIGAKAIGLRLRRGWALTAAVTTPLFVQGSTPGNAVITPEKARAIYQDPRSQYVIAKEYGVSQGQVSRIKLRKQWKAATADII